MRAWLPHCILASVLALEVLLALGRHQSREELEEQRWTGSVAQQLDALHVLTNRGSGHDAEFGLDFARTLYSSEDDRVREYAFSTDVCKYELPVWQEMMVEQRLPARGPSAHWWRSYVLFKRKVGGQVVGGSLRLRMQELRWFHDALRGVAPDRDASRRHLKSLQREMQSRRDPREPRKD